MHKVQVSPIDFEKTQVRKYRSHNVFDRTDMHAYIDINTALKSVRKRFGNDVDIVGDGSRYFELNLMVGAARESSLRNEKFWLDYSPLHFGGWRYWLKCLECRHRRTKLYITSDRVACMECLGLVYASRTGPKGATHIRLYRYLKSIDLLQQKRRMTYAGKLTRYGRQFQRYYQDLSDLA